MDPKVPTPKMIEYFVGKADIKDVQAGDDFCVVLLKDGTLHAMGFRSSCGKAVVTDHCYAPVLVTISSKIQSIVTCGRACTILLSDKKEWLAFGDVVIQGEPAYGKPVSAVALRIDDAFPQGKTVLKIVASKESFFMLCDNGDMYVMGRPGKGEMGCHVQIEKWTLHKQNVANVQTGWFNSFVFLK